MKKTYNISLGGQIFHLEEDAGDRLQSYIRTLENHYSREEGGSEIMNDIENRIAELFREFMQEPNKDVLTLKDIEQVIQIMGSPDDIIDEDYTENEKQNRRLYRDIDNRMLGGVAAGISAYLNVSVIAIRLCFLLLVFFYGFTIWVYLVLWIIVPAAITSKQKLEMKGEKINISNIEKNIRDSFQKVKENSKAQETIRKTTGFISEILNDLGNVLLTIGKVVLSILSVFIFIIVIFLLVGLGCLFFNIDLFHWDLNHLFFPPAFWGSYPFLFKAAFLLTVITPLVLLLWLTSKQLFRFKADKTVPLALTGLWIFGIFLLIFTGLSQIGKIAETNRDITTTELTPMQDSCLVIQTNPRYSVSESIYYWGDLAYRYEKDRKYLLKEPELRFEEAQSDYPEIVVIRKGRGYSRDNAYKNAKSIEYNWKIQNDTLLLDNYFSIPSDKKWKMPDVNIIIRLPENYRVFLDDNLLDGPEFTNWYGFQGTGKYYTMRDGRLQIKK